MKKVRVALMLLCLVGLPQSVWAARYKTTIRSGLGSFAYTAPYSSDSVSSILLGVAWDMAVGQISSIGIDFALGLGLSEKLISYSQVNFLYKYYPFTYSSFFVAGDADTRISVRSQWYPYLAGGLGYSTLVVKAKASASSTIIVTTNSQYFNFALGGGTDYSISDRWGLNAQLLASYGSGGTATGTLTATGYVAGLGVFFAF